MKKNIFFALFLFLNLLVPLVTLTSCSTTDPKLEPDLKLELKDVSCTEAWLQLTTNNIQLPATINLLNNNVLSQIYVLNTQDSLLYIDSLLPNQNYSFQVSSIQNPVSSNKVTATTLDTSSHNFTWQTFEFGQHSSSTLYDVAIINENDIWAVGEIYMNDSYGNPDPTSYNAVHWNGQNWELIKIGGHGGYPRRTVFAFLEDDVWFDGVIKWDGVNYTVHMNGFPLEPNGDGWQVNKMWGSGSNDLYAVGAKGHIAQYNGSSWKKITTGTTSIINDAWGIINNQNKTIVYCAVSSFFVEDDKKILKIVDGVVDSVSWGRDIRLYSAWTNNENFIYVCGEGVFVNKFDTWEQINLPAITTNSIRGNDINDVFVVGSLGTIFHFNGMDWNVISSFTQKENYRVDFKNNIVAICGYYNGKGFVEIGRRN